MREIISALDYYGILPAVPFALVITILYSAARVLYIKLSKHSRKSFPAEIARAALVWYIATLIVVVWFIELPALLSGKISLEVFAEETFRQGDYAQNGRFMKLLGGDFSILLDSELQANIALFVPYGILLPTAFRRLRWWAVDLIGIGTTVLIELVQPFFGRSFDVDDIAANSMGAIIGCILAKIALQIAKSRKSSTG